MKYLVVALFSLVVAFIVGNLVYAGNGKVIVSMAAILFVLVSGAVSQEA